MDAASKPLLASVTFWGAVLTLVSVLLPHLGLDLVDASGWAADLAALGGVLVSLAGRIRATRRIRGLYKGVA
ncbi:MAG TPA: hypothetical protein PLW81_06130 [Thiobacillaceae bacterium]|nr:hypothetical protein [Thiobacillaceae bacterium]